MNARWWPHTRDANIASVRLRCLRIVEQLRREGADAALYQPRTPAPRVLVLSKRYDDATLQHALGLRQAHGTRVLLDLCDNHFHFEGSDPALQARAERLRRACNAADGVIVASATLGEIVEAECPRQAHVAVIPDAAEAPWRPAAWPRWRAELWLRRLQRQLQTAGAPLPRRLVWFGNQGSAGTEGGMGDLASIRPQLEQAHRSRPLSLSVISNSEQKFRALTAGWPFPCLYLPWEATTFSRALQLHSACVIPVRPNPFTRCKTNNRLATALLHDLNVLADEIPSYTEFAGCTVLDNWPHGLGTYLSDTQRRAADLQQGQRLLHERYSLQTVARQWKALMEGDT